MPGYLGPLFSKPIRDNVPGGFGKDRTLQRVLPDLLSNHATAIEKERCQANAEEHPKTRQYDHPSHAPSRVGVSNSSGGARYWPF
jgi:hypothetical protein